MGEHALAGPFIGGPSTVSESGKTTLKPYIDNAVPPSSRPLTSANPSIYVVVTVPTLRAPPTRKANMPAPIRPSTSGGPGSGSQTSSNFNFAAYDKRVSRDDSFLGLRPRTAGTGSFEMYSAVYRGQLPTPEASPNSKPLRRPTAPPFARMPSPEYLESLDAPIGMALGSPTHQPTNWAPQHVSLKPESTHGSPTSPMSVTGRVDSPSVPMRKKENGKKRFFGLFGRKHSDSSQTTASESDPNETRCASRATQASPQPQADSRAKPSRSNTVFSRRARQKPSVSRSQTMPPVEMKTQGQGALQPSQMGQPAGASVTNLDGSSSAYGRSTSDFGSIPIVLDSNTAPGATSTPPQQSGMLNVDIPEAHMERYSVMFNDVLHSKQSASSLLARRQATLDRLKNISDASDDKKMPRPRGQTAPQPAKRSPSFAVFPPTPTSKQASQMQAKHQHSLSRSNTSPAFLPSPLRQTFDKSSHTDETSTEGAVKESPNGLESPAPVRARTTATYPVVLSPQWEIVAPSRPVPSTASSETSSRKRSPSSSSSAHTHVTKPSLDLDNLDNPVAASIARQISVSRDQRKMLPPLRTGRRSPIPMLNNNEKLSEINVQTPTIFTPRGPLDPHLAAHRRSERIVVEED